MMERNARTSFIKALPLLWLAILLMYSYARIFQAPYPGFSWLPNGTIRDFYVATTALELGDRITQIGAVRWEDYRTDWRVLIFENARPGEIVPVLIERADQPLVVLWVYPGRNAVELYSRLIGEWWLAYVFWLAGTATLLFVRPTDTRWRLLIAFNYLTALLIAAGSASPYHVFASSFVLHASVWLCFPIYLHLHWLFPTPIGKLPKPLLWGSYAVGLAGALSEWLVIIPPTAYFLALLAAVGGSLFMLISRYAFRTAQRRDVNTLALTMGSAALIAAFGAGIGGALSALTPVGTGAALLTLPLLPAMYFYVAYRRQLGGSELRANRLISFYLFFILLGLVLSVAVYTATEQFHFPDVGILIALGASAVSVITGVFTFSHFQRFVERRLLGIPVSRADLIESYAAQITASLNRPALVSLITNEVLPSLLIRQSALLFFDGRGVSAVYAQAVVSGQLPALGDIPGFLAAAGRYRPPDAGESTSHPFAWIRLALALAIDDHQFGLWLFGQCDPDDFYSQREVGTLRSLANQTAIALKNISQAEQLRALYQSNTEAHESHRAHVARELHDGPLNDLIELKFSVAGRTTPPDFFARCDALIDSLRQVISGLRPAMLGHGPRAALRQLADELADRIGDGEPQVFLELSGDFIRYDPQLELHVYRIVQQACDNTLKHAQARRLAISGQLEPDLIDLTVEDNGKGFDFKDTSGLAGLGHRGHFGLAGMIERAALIGAELTVDSALGRGTRVRLRWQANGKP